MVGNLQPTLCAICRKSGDVDELYPANLNPAAFTTAVFSARRLPDRLHYRMVKCRTCGLVRADPVLPPDELKVLYQHSSFAYQAEIDHLKHTYGHYLHRLERLGVNKGSLLEVGCGNGFFLEEALSQGYAAVKGVEPSQDAILQANPGIKQHINAGLMENGIFEPESFDVICLFQVLDHLPDPLAVLAECHRLLKKQGFLLALNHNINAISAILFGERSPIIDVEHTYLFSPSTMQQLSEKAGFKVRQQGVVFNAYSLHYLARLLPINENHKKALLSIFEKSHLGEISLKYPLGNQYLVGQKTG